MSIARLLRAAMLVSGLALMLLPQADIARAQTAAQAPADPAKSQGAFRPIVLTDAMMTAYIAALPKIAIYTKQPKPGALQNANPKYVARLEAVAKKRGFQSYEEFYWRGLESIAKTHGFPNYGEFIQLSATVALILTGINAETKVFTEPKDVLEDQIAFLARTIAKMNKDLMAAAPGEDPAKVLAPIAPFQQTLDEMMEGRATLQEKTDPANVELVLKYFNQIIWIGGGRTLSK